MKNNDIDDIGASEHDWVLWFWGTLIAFVAGIIVGTITLLLL